MHQLQGNDVVIIKNGHRICGTGVCLANTPINQDKAYFEVKLQQEGLIQIFNFFYFI